MRYGHRKGQGGEATDVLPKRAEIPREKGNKDGYFEKYTSSKAEKERNPWCVDDKRVVIEGRINDD